MNLPHSVSDRGCAETGVQTQRYSSMRSYTSVWTVSRLEKHLNSHGKLNRRRRRRSRNSVWARHLYGKNKQIFMASTGRITDLSCRLNAVMPFSYECNWFVMEKCELCERVREVRVSSLAWLLYVDIYVGEGPGCTCCTARIPMRRASVRWKWRVTLWHVHRHKSHITISDSPWLIH